MYQISLFTGAMGGDLATVHILGWRPVLYCEIDKYCQSLITQRVKDGYLPDAPIWGDVRTLRGRILEPYRRLAEEHPVVITAGFPCQPWSIAGKQKGESDDRNFWPDTIRIIREVRPQFCFLENVPALLAGSHGYFGQILGDLAESGYDARWCVLSAAEVGAPHLRKRIWILAYPQSKQTNRIQQSKLPADAGAGSIQMADSNEPGSQRYRGCGSERECWCQFTTWACCRTHEDERLARSGIRRISHGVSNRVDRLKALGNAQVPEVARRAWLLLTGGLDAS